MRNFFLDKEFNTTILESENFRVIPTLGAMVEGWMLLIPKDHYINLASLPESHKVEFENLVDNTRKLISNQYNSSVICFEHGAKDIYSEVGCTVDYAHLHILPFQFDLIKGLNELFQIKYDWQSLVSILDIAKNPKFNLKDYLLYLNDSGELKVAFGDTIPSQLFRKVIAKYLNQSEKFDWRIYPFNENIKNTIIRIKKAI